MVNDALPPLVLIDAANVVGSVPDGWWRDRVGATERLRDALGRVASDGLPTDGNLPAWASHPPLEVVLVVEGAARDVAETPTVRVHSARGSGDDAIVELVRAADAERCLVITADRQLRERVTALGASVAGPRTVRR